MRELTFITLILGSTLGFVAAGCGSTASEESLGQTSQELKAGAGKAPPEDNTTPVAAAPKAVSVANAFVAPTPRLASPAEVKGLQAAIAAQRAKNANATDK